MDADTGATIGNVFKIVFIVVAIVALYYLYNYLFVRTTDNTVTLFREVKNVNQVQPLVKTSDQFPPLMEGGEYTVSFWLYIQNWGSRAGYNKHVLSIGSTANGFYTLAVFLGANSNTLHIRTQATDSTGSAGPSAIPALTNANVAAVFANPMVGDATSLPGFSADIPNIEMQKWTLVSIVLNGNSIDVYMDGKLAKSVVSPSFFRVPQGGYQLTAFGSNGFGGYMSNLQMSSTAINPDDANRLYQAGPVGVSSFLEWLRSFFDPTAMENMIYPKMN
jgi:hypothetical protein